MTHIGKVLVMCLMFGFLCLACNNTKAEKQSVISETATEEKDKSDNNGDTIDHGYEVAMASYQCPMKCEGDTFYEEEGSCPKCKMDLKKVDKESKEKEENHQHKE